MPHAVHRGHPDVWRAAWAVPNDQFRAWERGERERGIMMKKATENTAAKASTTKKVATKTKATKAAAKKPPVSNSVKDERKVIPLTEADARAAAKNVAAKMNRPTLENFLRTFIQSKDHMKLLKKETADSLRYTVRNMSRATIADLRSIAPDLLLVLGDAPLVSEEAAPAPSNSVKGRTLRKKEAPAEEEKKEPAKKTLKAKKSVEPEEAKEDPKAKAKKPAPKAEEPKEEPKAGTKSRKTELLEMFPEELSVMDGNEETTLVLSDEEFKDYADVAKALNEDGEDIYLAVYWTKRHLKQFSYTSIPTIKVPKSFPNDMDIMQVIYAGENVCVAISRYTEVPGYYIPQMFEIDKEFKLRFANGAEFAVYKEA